MIWLKVATWNGLSYKGCGTTAKVVLAQRMSVLVVL